MYCILCVYACCMLKSRSAMGAGLVGDYIRKGLCPAHGTRDQL